MNENVRRYRGARILAALVDHHHGTTRWERLRAPPEGHPTPPQGRFDPHTQQWDTQAGPRTGLPQPLLTRITIPPETRIHYPGETIYLRPPDLERLLTRLHELNVLWAVTEYARDPTYTIASYWPSDGMIRWSRSIPHDLHRPLTRAVTALSDLLGSNP